ncbi:SMI1/KNR4 family protein [Ruminiclostridium cellobioparum]|uniref:SMI1/KNR4 family protein n=1 Tax=Ruminiclostridium cellobioparum TaxID=29355 RepID=UPI000480BDAA|nr:SMI1/KNR4 family protein [Ruminiclostridium cellobioparum]
MKIIENSVIFPLPSIELIKREEKMWRILLPKSYVDFIQRSNGGKPVERCFICNNRHYAIDRFLCILEDPEEHELGMYDIDVVLTQIEDRLSDNPDLVGIELLPIATLFAGDFVCLDYKSSKDNPGICVWSHEESEQDMPVTYFVADTFEKFCEMLID